MRTLLAVLVVVWSGCARTDFYYPSNGKEVVYDERGRPRRHHQRAIVLNGSDSLGATTIRITSNSLEFINQGGIDNSTSTREGYRTARYGIGAASWVAGTAIVTGAGVRAYEAQQAASAASSRAAAKAASNAVQPLPQVGSTIPAQTSAVVTPVP